MPLVQVEYYFPDVEDPRIIMAAVLHYRHIFDKSAPSKVSYLNEHKTDNTIVQHIVWKKQGMVAARDLVEKRFLFEASEATDLTSR